MTTETTICPFCGFTIEYECDESYGIILTPDITLIASWIYHTKCWNTQVDMYPPFENVEKDDG